VSHEAAAALFKSGAIAPARPLIAPFPFRWDERTTRGLGVLEAATNQLIERWADQDPALPKVPFDARALPNALADARAGRRLLFTRFDVVCPADDPQAFSLLEVQAGDPSAMGWADLLCDAMKLPATLMPSHRRALEQRTAGRRIAFAIPDRALVRSDHLALAEHYQAHGWEAHVVDPAQFAFDGRLLTAGGHPVDAVFRDALDELLAPERLPGGEALLAAHAAGNVAVANPFSAAVADDKAWLESLSTEAGWDAATWNVLSRHVPCTRLVAERTVDWRGERVELLPFIRANRARLVLKPCEGYGGFGIVVGPFATPEQWNAAVLRALSGQRFVVQEFVPLPRHQLAWIDPQGAETSGEAFVVHSFWQHGGRFAGGYIRASTAPIVNVHQGGGLGVFQLEPPLE
jgi:hypothetical protein